MKSYKGNSWGFPKGKIDRDEDKVTCRPQMPCAYKRWGPRKMIWTANNDVLHCR